MTIKTINIEPGVTQVVLNILPAPSPPHVLGEPGIDVSRWQGEIDWERVAAAGIRFAGIRATTGATGKDIQFARNWAEAKRVGIQRMAYHYFINGLEPTSQLNNFLGSLGSDLGELPLVLDIEPRNISTDPKIVIYETVDKPRNTDMIRQWLTECQARAHRKISIYGNAWSLGMCTTYPASPIIIWLKEYYLWLAYHTTRPVPTVPVPWTTFMAWQYSATGKVDGITKPDGTPGNVDLNRWGNYP